MKILFVAMPFSIHTARWISQLEDSGIEIHFFSSFPYAKIHPELKNVHYHEYYHALPFAKNKNITYHPVDWYEINFSSPVLKKYCGKLLRFFKLEKSRQKTLGKIITKIKPDIIHSLETQHAGYLVSALRKKWEDKFPFWIHSNWGIDLHFFGKLKTHLPLINQTLSLINVVISEGKRDKELAINLGFKGPIYIFQGGGGFKILAFIQHKPPSERKKILIKGTQDVVRRGLVAIRAIERCIDVLMDYEIILYSSNEVTQIAAELFYQRTGKKITILNETSQEEMIKLNSEARLNICVNMSDGMPNAMLEAMMMGAFPVQADTSMADELIIHEKTGMIVPPEDPDILEVAIRKALKDDAMVDEAAAVNRKLIEERYNYYKIRQEVIEMYNRSAAS